MRKKAKTAAKNKSSCCSFSAAWAMKITPVTFCLSMVSSVFSQLVTTHAPTAVSVMLLLIMMALSVIFDGVGVAVTSCNAQAVKKFLQYDAKRVKIAMELIANAEKVNSVCADVVGDVCGVLSGACGAALAASLIIKSGCGHGWLPILTAATIAGMTVGGKAFMKGVAVKNADKYIVLAAKILSPRGRRKRKEKEEGK